jgi:hypothetical protein
VLMSTEHERLVGSELIICNVRWVKLTLSVSKIYDSWHYSSIYSWLGRWIELRHNIISPTPIFYSKKLIHVQGDFMMAILKLTIMRKPR